MESHEQLGLSSFGRKGMSIKDMFVKDAFLVFRALCKLTMKPLNNEMYVYSMSLSLPFD